MSNSRTIPYFVLAVVLFANLVSSQSSNITNQYKLISQSFNTQKTVYTALLAYTGSQTYYVNLTNPVVQYLNFTYVFHTASQLQVRITDANNTRWEVPNEAPFAFADPSLTIPINNGQASVTISANPFSFKVTRLSTNEVIFDTSVNNFIYSDYYIEVSTRLPSDYLYGLGERGYNLTLGPVGIYTIWPIDFNQNIEDGLGGHNSYGAHPVYLNKEKSGNWTMNLLRNLNAMDCVMNNSQGFQQLTYKITGGILDFNFFFGDASPENVVSAYHLWLGKWHVQPFWSLGYHQSRWGYNNLTQLTQVVENFTYFNLPLDVIWSDIDYMHNYLDFTIDDERFPHEPFRQMLAANQKRWVCIVDAGIGLNGSDIYDRGVEYDLYIKYPNGSYLVGSVWPGNTSWVDWFNPNASFFWDWGLTRIHDKVPYSGIWLDMNEISNLVNGSVGYVPNLTDIRNALPYTPGHPLYWDTIEVDAIHYNGQCDFNTHSLFNFMEQNVTFNHLKTIGPQPFILTRSNTFGTGKYAAHWTGDNNSSWIFMQISIPSIMNLNIFGIPMTGSDICGFKANATEEMCSRWMQLGLLYPFSRNHAENDTIHQEPWSLGPTLLETARIAMALKYSILKYYYSIFIMKNGTGTIYRPMFFEYPDDENCLTPELEYMDTQFMIGSALLGAPVLYEGVNTTNVYLPGDRWFDFFSGNLLKEQGQKGSVFPNYPAPLNGTIPLFLRGGYVVQKQNTNGVLSTEDLSNTFQLVTALLQNGSNSYYANGQILGTADYNESHIVTKCINLNCLINIAVTATTSSYQNFVRYNFTSEAKQLDSFVLDELYVYGLFQDGTQEAPETTLPQVHQIYYNGKLYQTKVVNALVRGPIHVKIDIPLTIGIGDYVTLVTYAYSALRMERD